MIVSYIFIKIFDFFWFLCDFLDVLIVGRFILNLVSGLLIFDVELFGWFIILEDWVDLWDLCIYDGDIVGLFVEFKLKFFCMGVFLLVFVFWDDVWFWDFMWFLDFGLKGLGLEFGEFFSLLLVVVGVFGVFGNLFDELCNIFLYLGLEFDIFSLFSCFVGKFIVL